MAYKKCPRCSLNYIKDTDVLCKVCLDEVGKAIRSNEDEEEYDICLECGEHIIKVGEEMCYQCMMEHVKDETDIEDQKRKSDEWDDGDFDPEDDEVEEFADDEPEEGLEEIELDLEEDADTEDDRY